MMYDYALSVIVPVYNVEQYLERCLQSLVNQTLQNIEIICVNDASTDESLRILKDYRDRFPEKLKIIDSPENLRQGGARNLGIEISRGEYIGFVDSDDAIDLEMYEKMYNIAVKQNVDVVSCDYYIVDGKGNRKIVNTLDEITLGRLKKEDIQEIIIFGGGYVWSKIFRNTTLKGLAIKFPEKLAYEDNAYSPVVMAAMETFYKIKEPLYFYYKNEQSTTNKTNSYHQFDRLKTAKLMVEMMKDINVYDEYKEAIDFLFIRLFYINTIGICLSMFNPIEINYMQKVRNFMKINLPNYRSNKFFCKRISIRQKIMTKMNDIDPHILATFYRIVNKTE